MQFLEARNVLKYVCRRGTAPLGKLMALRTALNPLFRLKTKEGLLLRESREREGCVLQHNDLPLHATEVNNSFCQNSLFRRNRSTASDFAYISYSLVA